MFLVSWSLFSRLSRMKDSVSSSCKKWRGGCHPEPVVRGDHHRPPSRPTPTRVSASTPDSPCPGALASLSALLHLLQLVFDFPPPGGSLLRGNHRSGQPCSHCPLTSLRRPLGFRPGHTHFRPRPCPPPGRAGGAMLGVAVGSVYLSPRPSRMGCGLKPS